MLVALYASARRLAVPALIDWMQSINDMPLYLSHCGKLVNWHFPDAARLAVRTGHKEKSRPDGRLCEAGQAYWAALAAGAEAAAAGAAAPPTVVSTSHLPFLTW